MPEVTQIANVTITGPAKIEIAALLNRALKDTKIMTVTSTGANAGMAMSALWSNKRRLAKALKPYRSTELDVYSIGIDTTT